MQRRHLFSYSSQHRIMSLLDCQRLNFPLLFGKMSGSRKYPHHTHGRDLPYDPPSPLDFPKSTPKMYPVPSGISKTFTHPLELSLIELNKWVALFTRVYFLLNSITYKQIPYENSMCSSHKQILWVSCIFCWILQQISKFLMCSQSSCEEIVEQVLSHTQMKCMGNIMVLFSHCIKKKATLDEL